MAIPTDNLGRLSLLYNSQTLPRPRDTTTWATLKRAGIKLKRIRKSPGWYQIHLPKHWSVCTESNTVGWFTLRNALQQPRFAYCCLLDEQSEVVEAYTRAIRRYEIGYDSTPSPVSLFDHANGQRRNDLLNYYLYDFETGKRVPFGPFDERLGHTQEECHDEILKSYPDPSPDAYWTEPPKQPAWWQLRRWLR